MRQRVSSASVTPLTVDLSMMINCDSIDTFGSLLIARPGLTCIGPELRVLPWMWRTSLLIHPVTLHQIKIYGITLSIMWTVLALEMTASIGGGCTAGCGSSCHGLRPVLAGSLGDVLRGRRRQAATKATEYVTLGFGHRVASTGLH